MSIQMTSGYGRKTELGYDTADPVCLYDTTDGMAFGPIFEDREEAGAFLRWIERNGIPLTEYRQRGAYDQKDSADKWRSFLADHPEAECPFDGEDSVGFLTDRDRSDGSGAWTPFCQCECHNESRVAVLGGYAE